MAEFIDWEQLELPTGKAKNLLNQRLNMKEL